MRHWVILLLVLFAPQCWPDNLGLNKVCKNNAGAILGSLQGKVFFETDVNHHWQQAKLNDLICEGSRVSVEQDSIAELSLPNDITLRLEAGTIMTLKGLTPNETTLLALLKGFILFISRTSKQLEISTPIANLGPQGTEFAIRVDESSAALWVYEGKVKFFNQQGSLLLQPGQGAQAYAGQAPQTQIDIKPEDAINWALYYPPLLPYLSNSALMEVEIRTAIDYFRHGRVDDALFRLNALPPEKRNTYFYKVRGAIRLTAGQDKQVLQDSQTLLAKNPKDAEALALQSVLALTQNRREEAFTLANQAVAADPHSSSAYSALAYVEQGRFQLDKALEAAEQAVKYAPNDAMVWARKAELELTKGLTADSEATTQQALELDASLERIQTVRGFSYLQRMETEEARQAFEKAIQLDSTSPLARLGLGLAKIRQGHLHEGRRDLEIAVILDPNNSLLRSYLGKAYFEENRNTLAADQLSLAKARDPKDPTPYFYDAIKKQTENRPVEALQDLQQAMALNDNRAVYRSKQLLDSDRAARGASLARIYDNLGFEQRGIVEATTSLQLDPTNFSAHRFLSDTYVNQSSHETAQLSELLQAKLLQPININPVQPHLAVSQRGLLNASGMASSSFQDFTRNFEGNRPQLIVSGVAGNMGTYSDEMTLSGLLDKFSYSLGQYHYQTDGFTRIPNPAANPPLDREAERHNTDQHHDIYDAFLQGAVSDRLSVQFEYIYRDTEQGDFRQNITIPISTQYLERDRLRESIYRAGLNLRIFSDDHILASYIKYDSLTNSDPFAVSQLNISKSKAEEISNDTDVIEGQYLHSSWFLNIITGFSFYSINEKYLAGKNKGFSGPNNGLNGHSEYIYVNLKLPAAITGTFGLSYNFSDKVNNDDPKQYPKSTLYPKVGIMWDLSDKVKLRLAYIEGKKRPGLVTQSIEPTQIAGFNQFFDDYGEYNFSFYGGAVDFVLKPKVFAGIEFYRREVFDSIKYTFFSKKDSAAIYLGWTPSSNLSLSARYKYRKDIFSNNSLFLTQSLPLELRYFDSSGFFGQLTETYVDQSKENYMSGEYIGSSSFFLLDATIGFRLPNRIGIVSVEGKNLLNKKYRLSDFSQTDNSSFFYNSSDFIPERAVFVRVTFNF